MQADTQTRAEQWVWEKEKFQKKQKQTNKLQNFPKKEWHSVPHIVTIIVSENRSEEDM